MSEEKQRTKTRQITNKKMLKQISVIISEKLEDIKQVNVKLIERIPMITNKQILDAINGIKTDLGSLRTEFNEFKEEQDKRWDLNDKRWKEQIAFNKNHSH